MADCKEFIVSVLSCKDLIASDLNGSTDPYVVVGLLEGEHKRQSFGKTAVVKKNMHPTFPDNSTRVPFDPSKRLFLDVMDEDFGKDDKTCGLKVPLPEIVANEPKTYTMELKKKGVFKTSDKKPMITFTVTPIIDRPPPPPPEQMPPPPPPKPEGAVGKLEVEGPNVYEYNILIVDLDEKKYWTSEKSLPRFAEKGELEYRVDAIPDKHLILVPYIKTTEPFQKGHKVSVAFGEAKIETTQIYRGEFSLGVIKVADGRFELLDDKLKVNRKNYTNDEWIAAFPEEVIPKGEYKEQ